ncbi:MAG: cytochrome c3 family protein [Myxococcales bacterium]|nr:cytochrome c3 family protein [Myxococcales bacterium]USN50229.1 MAG: cytochrome c3 family protein [Myxococcales bacterium]
MPQIFPKWSNTVAKLLPVVLVIGVGFSVFVFWYWFSPLNLEVGYEPHQPIPFSHKLHVSDLGIDCMYCHTQAEKSAYAGVPSTQTCMNCHEHQANKNSLPLSGLMRSWQSGGINGTPIEWKRVHKIGGYAYFDHSAHISAGVGCISCHGNIDHMQIVRQEKPLSMGWCLECHRNPAPNLRPVNEVTNMNYHQSENYKKMAQEREKMLNAPVESCSGCHR